jgi:hypothetical protein
MAVRKIGVLHDYAIVVADFVSFAATILFESPSLTRSVAPPPKMRLASLDSHFAFLDVGVLTDYYIVVADFVSFAATILFESPSLTHSVASPPKTGALASLGTGFD